MTPRATRLRRWRSSACALAAILFCAGPVAAEGAYVAIEQRLSAEQLHATGLDQLSDAQLSLLNQLLRDEQAKAAAERARDPGRQQDAPVTSAIRGEVRGWSAGTVFALENGQRWRVVEGDYYAPAPLRSPRATVRPGVLGSWYLRIEGVSVGAKVRRIEP